MCRYLFQNPLSLPKGTYLKTNKEETLRFQYPIQYLVQLPNDSKIVLNYKWQSVTNEILDINYLMRVA